MRIGTGYDIHELCEGRDLIIGGVKIPHTKGLSGHSDADVLCHAIIDALLGSVALRDIGYHFPDTDDEFKNANSLFLLKKTAEMLQNEGYKVINIDSSIIAQKPKMSHYIEQMRENIAKTLNIGINQVSVKAKTNEKMDSAGCEKSIIVHAVVLVDLINSEH